MANLFAIDPASQRFHPFDDALRCYFSSDKSILFFLYNILYYTFGMLEFRKHAEFLGEYYNYLYGNEGVGPLGSDLAGEAENLFLTTDSLLASHKQQELYELMGLKKAFFAARVVKESIAIISIAQSSSRAINGERCLVDALLQNSGQYRPWRWYAELHAASSMLVHCTNPEIGDIVSLENVAHIAYYECLEDQIAIIHDIVGNQCNVDITPDELPDESLLKQIEKVPHPIETNNYIDSIVPLLSSLNPIGTHLISQKRHAVGCWAIRKLYSRHVQKLCPAEIVDRSVVLTD